MSTARPVVVNKLPKQWKYWCKTQRMHPHGCNSKWARSTTWFYLKGHNHVWRINCYGEFQLGDTIEKFDRWALCDNIISCKVPETELEFKETVLYMLHVKYI